MTNITERIVETIEIAAQRKIDARELARRAGMAYSTLMDAKAGRIKRPGRLAELADAAGVSYQWLSTGQGEKMTNVRKIRTYMESAEEKRRRDKLDIPLLDVHASMGGGVLATQHDNVVEQVSVDIHLMRGMLNFSAPDSLRILTAIGESMSPTLHDGDLLLVDTGITEIKIDAIYVMQREEELFVKRMQRRPDGRYLMRSDNELYESFTLEQEDLDNFRVIARVLCVWNLRRL